MPATKNAHPHLAVEGNWSSLRGRGGIGPVASTKAASFKEDPTSLGGLLEATLLLECHDAVSAGRGGKSPFAERGYSVSVASATPMSVARRT